MVCVKVTFNSTVRVDAKKEQQPDKISLASFPGVVTVPLIVSYGKQVFSTHSAYFLNTLEPRINEGPRD